MEEYKYKEVLMAAIALDYFIILHYAEGLTCFFLFVAFTVFIVISLGYFTKSRKKVVHKECVPSNSFVEAWKRTQSSSSVEKESREWNK